jgi:DNA-binding transcriptional regulator LsrR (DeoR family)
MSDDGFRGAGRGATAMIVQVARLYYEQGLTQPAIAERLRISQSRVSRWLKEATERGIVRTVVLAPDGVFPELEEALVAKFQLRQALVVDASGDEQSIMSALGATTAAYLESTLEGGARVGFSSWSSTLLATVDSMMPLKRKKAESIVQVMGGVGRPEVQVKATQLTHRLAMLTGAEPKFLPTPGIVSSRSARDALFQDPHVADIAREWEHLTDVLIGIGSVTPSPLLTASGNSVSDADLASLRSLGAVGDVAMRFFDVDGNLIDSELNDRVVGIGVDELRRIPRRVGIAGGERKFEAIRGAVRGGWIDVLITDLVTAQRLVDDDSPPGT